MIGRPSSRGVRRYICFDDNREDGPKAHLAMTAEALELHVCRVASGLQVPRGKLSDPAEPLVLEREDLLSKQTELTKRWTGGGISDHVWEVASDDLQSQIGRLDAEIERLQSNVVEHPCPDDQQSVL